MGILYNAVKKINNLSNFSRNLLLHAQHLVLFLWVVVFTGGIFLPHILALAVGWPSVLPSPSLGWICNTALNNQNIPSPCLGDTQATQVSVLKLSIWWAYSLSSGLQMAGVCLKLLGSPWRQLLENKTKAERARTEGQKESGYWRPVLTPGSNPAHPQNFNC